MTEEFEGSRVFTAEQKFKIVKEALTTDQGVSGTCRKYGVNVSLFYKWQEKFFAGAKEGLERKSSDSNSKEQRKIAELENDRNRMRAVIAEITAENIAFKKSLGEL